MRVAVYGIALDEAANVEAWAAALTDADVILLADTGSTDNTVELAKAAGVTVHHLSIRPFRFDTAWNSALALLPADVDVAVLCSLDIRPEQGWREKVEEAWPADEQPTTLRCWLDVGGLRWRLPLAHSRHGFHYRYPVHELLTVDARLTETQHDCDITFRHQGNSRRTPADNLPALAAARAENPHDLHMLHYYGRELMYAGRHDEAIRTLTAHATSDAFPEERCESWIYVGDCMLNSQPTAEVEPGPYRQATVVAPWRREGWMKLAMLARMQARWQDCLESAEHTLAITQPSWYFNWPYASDVHAHDEGALASHFLGLHADAIRHGASACALAPEDERLAANLRWYREAAPLKLAS